MHLFEIQLNSFLFLFVFILFSHSCLFSMRKSNMAPKSHNYTKGYSEKCYPHPCPIYPYTHYLFTLTSTHHLYETSLVSFWLTLPLFISAQSQISVYFLISLPFYIKKWYSINDVAHPAIHFGNHFLSDYRSLPQSFL